MSLPTSSAAECKPPELVTSELAGSALVLPNARLPEDPVVQLNSSYRLQEALELVGLAALGELERDERAVEAAAYRLVEIAPRDPIEQMMAAQMLAMHGAVMDCTRRAALPGQDAEVRRDELNLAGKASRTFAQLADTFDRRRRGGKQKVTVEHVHVHAGGQAIVGQVTGVGRGQPKKGAE